MNSERLKDLLFSYLNSTLDQEEYDELLLYINDDVYIEVIYESMDHEWQADKIQVLLSDAEQGMVFAKIKGDSRFTVPKAKVAMSRFWPFNVRILNAAAVLIIISAGIYLANGRLFNAPSSQYFTNINPGTSKAVLTLADGRKIPLNQSNKGKLAEQSGTAISNTIQGQLVYQGNDQQHNAASLNILETPKGGEYQLQLPDGTKVWLNAASSLKYPASFAASKERRVILSGEAYFEVAHNPASPFRVVTAQQVVEVLGTHFNVNAYPNEPDTKTTLLEGSVKIAQQSQAKQLILKPGQQAQVGGGSAEVTDVDTETAIAWKNGDFILKDEGFKTTMRKIARWYDVDIIYEESAPVDFELGGWVSRSKNITAVLKVIESTGKVHFKVLGRRVTVTK